MDTGSDTPTACWRDVGVFLAVALAFRVFYMLAIPGVLDTADAVHYIDTAGKFAQGDFFGINPKIPVLYPALAALVTLLGFEVEMACNLASLLASTLLVVPLYGFSRDLFGRGPARIATALACFWPWLADYGSRVGPDALGCTLWFLAIWMLARCLRRGGWYCAAAPLAFFALHLTRAEGTILLAASVGGALILCAGPDWKRLARYVPFVAGCAALLALSSLYMRSLVGEATVNYRVGIILVDLEIGPMISTAMKLMFEVLPIMLGPVAMLFFGVGLFGRDDTARERDFRLEAYTLYFAAVQLASSAFVLSAQPRYLMSVIVALSLWNARGMVILGARARTLRWGKVLRWAPVALALSLMLLGTALDMASQYAHRRPKEPLEYRQAGLWMKQHLEPGLIFTRKPQIGYYAGMLTLGPHELDSLEQAIARAQAAKARYFVVDERYTAQMVPGVAPLLDPANAPPSLLPVKQFDLYPETRVMIYEVLPPENASAVPPAP